MAETTEQEHHRPGPPDGKVIGAVAPASVETVIAALAAAGFPAERIDRVTGEELADVRTPHNDNRVVGLFERFLLSMGEDLAAMEELRNLALAGSILIGVPVHGEAQMHRAGQVLREHGAHEITHFGRWVITTL